MAMIPTRRVLESTATKIVALPGELQGTSLIITRDRPFLQALAGLRVRYGLLKLQKMTHTKNYSTRNLFLYVDQFLVNEFFDSG